MKLINSEPRRLEPGSYEYEFLYQIYGRAWEYPLPEDFDEVFSHIHTTVVTERCRKILIKHLVERKTLKEIANEDGVTTERIRILEQKPFNIIRSSGLDQVLINGISYYTNDSTNMLKMPIILASHLMRNPISTRTKNGLLRCGLRTLEDLLNAAYGDLYSIYIRGLGTKSMEEIHSIVDYYSPDAGVASFQSSNQYISSRTVGILVRYKLNFPEILRHMTDDEILNIRGIGKSGLDEIRIFLDHYDFENHQLRDKEEITSDPNVRTPDMGLYKTNFLKELYGKPWDYPIQPDFDETFSIIQRALTEDESRILYKIYAQSMAFYEVAEDEGLKIHNIHDIIENSFSKIRETGGVEALIHGVSYFTKDERHMKRMPLILVLGMRTQCLSQKSIKLLSNRGLNTLGKIYEMVRSGDVYSVPEMLIDDINSLLKDYDFCKDATMLLFCRKCISTRTFHILMDAKILSPEILINMSQEELLKIHGIGEKTLRDIKYLLDHYDFETRQIRD